VVLMDLPAEQILSLLRLERKRDRGQHFPLSRSLSSLDSGSIETKAQQYSQPPFPALICLFSTRDRPGNI